MRVKEKDLAGLSYIQREQSFVHHTYDEECRLFELIKRGEERVVELDSRKFCGAHYSQGSGRACGADALLFIGFVQGKDGVVRFGIYPAE